MTGRPAAADGGGVAQVDTRSPAVVVQRVAAVIGSHQTPGAELLLHLDAADVNVGGGSVVVSVSTPGLPGGARSSLSAAESGVAGPPTVPRRHVLYWLAAPAGPTRVPELAPTATIPAAVVVVAVGPRRGGLGW